MAYITVAEVKNVRELLKEKFPKFKFLVSGGNSLKLRVDIVKGPVDFTEVLGEWKSIGINEYHLHLYGEHQELFEEILKVMKSQDWFDKSDSMTDYFNVAYYTDLSIGRWNKPYEMVK